MLNISFEELKSIQLLPEDYPRYIPSIKPIDSSLKNTAQAYLDKCREVISRLHRKNYHPENIVRINAQMFDQLMIYLFQTIEQDLCQKLSYTGRRATLMAQGGYGRGIMNIQSDIDLLFLCRTRKGEYVENLTEKILYLLWDLDLDVGYATRTVGECKKLMLKDITIMTSLLDARYLCGDPELADDFSRGIRSFLESKTVQNKLVKQKLDEQKDRIRRYGGSVFVLEPNVRDGMGGLRDYQMILWIAKIQLKAKNYIELLKEEILEEDEYNTLILARDFLWRIRNEIHLLSGNKSDSLTSHRQEIVAKNLGFRKQASGILGVEQFMQDYFKLAYQISLISDAAIRRLTTRGEGIKGLLARLKTRSLDENFKIKEGQIAARQPDVFKRKPRCILQIFKHVQDRGLPIHTETKDYLRAAQPVIDDKFRQNEANIQSFRSMMNDYHHLGDVLFAMHEVQLLDEWLPEFKKLRCRVQHDIYHTYTIDTHSIFAVNELSKLEAGSYKGKFDFYKEVLGKAHRPELLTMGLFLHDIGKGEGGNHSVKGAEIANRLTRRLGYSEADQKVIEFLVLSHLMMPHLSQRRDLEDQSMITEFARSMTNQDNLNMLFLLTWGDIRAVGPEAWTDWKGSLLQRLYTKTSEVIKRGEFTIDRTYERVERARKALLDKFGKKYSAEAFEKFLLVMPPRYFFAASEDEIERHFLLKQNRPHQGVITEFGFLPDEKLHELLIDTLYTPNIFSLVTGAMAAHAVNIIRADVFQTRDGHLLLTLKVTDAQGKPFRNPDLFDRIRLSLENVLSGQIKVADLLAAKLEQPDYMVRKPVQKAKSRVVIDNDVSAYYTVIDVYAHDRIGLLFDITRTLNELGLYIEVSKISTKVEQVSDAFYVKDIFGKKISSKQKLKEVKKALMKIVNPIEDKQAQKVVRQQ